MADLNVSSYRKQLRKTSPFMQFYANPRSNSLTSQTSSPKTDTASIHSFQGSLELPENAEISLKTDQISLDPDKNTQVKETGKLQFFLIQLCEIKQKLSLKGAKKEHLIGLSLPERFKYVLKNAKEYKIELLIFFWSYLFGYLIGFLSHYALNGE